MKWVNFLFQTRCGHNFCLQCFKHLIRQGNRTCALYRKKIPSTMASQPRINPTLVFAIRMANMSKSNGSDEGSSKVYDYVHNQPPIKGITGQQDHGAQSIILSGGYKDDEDHGEWFLYTGRYVIILFCWRYVQLRIYLLLCFILFLLQFFTTGWRWFKIISFTRTFDSMISAWLIRF